MKYKYAIGDSVIYCNIDAAIIIARTKNKNFNIYTVESHTKDKRFTLAWYATDDELTPNTTEINRNLLKEAMGIKKL